MQPVKTLRFVFVSGVATVAMLFLTVATLQFVAPPADATPALAKGKSCKTCHSSGSPSKSDLKKKKKSELWPGSSDAVVALRSFALTDAGAHMD
jgi:hypothetical protein